ncbi:MAG TPA: EF-P lysine aminoacylase EpmA [Xanthobacteraceae bacterium]|jgi:lysyl-tRNA synthetase class 2
MPPRIPFWNANFHAERRPFLLQRGEIIKALREHFAELEFVEVETAVLQISPGNETHLQAFKTELLQPGYRDRRYLRTSPEFACKKLIAAGERRIVEFARVFRNNERAPLHHPEFTLLEWYRAHGRYELLMEDCMTVIACAADTVRTRSVSWRERIADPCAEPERLTVAEAFSLHAGIDFRQTLSPEGADRLRFAVMASDIGVYVSKDDTWGDIFSRIMSEKVEPYLGLGRPTILDEYPAAMSPLARPKSSDPSVAERFEVYLCGVEVANGFGELNDASEQRRRLAAQMAEKERIYHERYPIDDDFINALRSMPAACGVALGLDRLVMLVTGAPDIEHVMWTPVAGV